MGIVSGSEAERASVMPGGTTTYLVWQSTGSEITKRELESTIAALNVDLQSDQGVGGRGGRRHDCGLFVSANKLR